MCLNFQEVFPLFEQKWGTKETFGNLCLSCSGAAGRLWASGSHKSSPEMRLKCAPLHITCEMEKRLQHMPTAFPGLQYISTAAANQTHAGTSYFPCAHLPSSFHRLWRLAWGTLVQIMLRTQPAASFSLPRSWIPSHSVSLSVIAYKKTLSRLVLFYRLPDGIIFPVILMLV